MMFSARRAAGERPGEGRRHHAYRRV